MTLPQRRWEFNWDAWWDSDRRKAMKDYAQLWYFHLCAAARFNIERPGCVRDDMRTLWQQAGCTAGFPFFLKESAPVIACFVPTGDGWLRHEKVNSDAARASATSEKRRKAAQSKVTANAEHLQKPEGVFVFALNSDSEIEKCFLRAWKFYPVKKAKGKAWQYFKRHASKIAARDKKSDFDAAEWIEIRLIEYGNSPHIKLLLDAGKKAMIPYMGSWLNAERYDDAVGEWEAESVNAKETVSQQIERVLGGVGKKASGED